jgi:hypothetical protein
LVPQCRSLRLHCSSSRFFPTDCHDSPFECLDLGFQRDSTPFNQCRLQLIIDRRQDTRARRFIRAANRIESSNHHHRPHSVEVPRPKKQRRPPRSGLPATSVTLPAIDGPASKAVQNFWSERIIRQSQTQKVTRIRQRRDPTPTLPVKVLTQPGHPVIRKNLRYFIDKAMKEHRANAK